MTIPDPEKVPARSRSPLAHDFNDFEVGKRHKLAVINIPEQGRHADR
ncbi:MAG: hypothetical protein H6924_02250 [Alphaproteobacteria bacterium]|nr:hypothetical protein [Alphaproteobacteria bacterium]